MLLQIVRAASTDAAVAVLVSGDSSSRGRMLGSGAYQWSSGAAVPDLQLSRSAAGLLLVDSASTANITRLRVSATSGQTAILDVLVAGDAAARARLQGDATLTELALGNGTAAALRVVGQRKTGWTIMTGTVQRGTFATSTVTTAQLAGVVMALQQDLGTTASGHGLIDA